MLSTSANSHNLLNLGKFTYKSSLFIDFIQSKLIQEETERIEIEKINENKITEEKNKFSSYFNKIKKNFSKYNEEFGIKANSQFVKNPSISKSEIQSKIFHQNGIDFSIEFLKVDNLSKKPICINNQNEKTVEITHKDVFEPPFEDGILLDDNFMNLNNHRIVFNKYPIKDNHIILVSKEMRSQYTHLNFFEMTESVLLQHFIKGIIFFNGGKNSGASQPRKHVQSIPIGSLCQEEFGIFKLFNKKKNDLIKIEIDNLENINQSIREYFEVFTIRQFNENNIPHFLVDISRLTDAFNKSYEEILETEIDNYMKIVYNIYLNILENLKLISKNLDETNKDKDRIENDYSFLYTSNWIFIIPRKTDTILMKNGRLSLNSNSFTFSILVKSEELQNEVLEVDLIKDIYTKL